ncbi:shikimate kinase [Iamia majanohamensis]|uniref:Shikimate kinase n=1 Tax=Iamia majanohamensis TaxID=467976 RepID=A0AAE9YI39_9ACTN|nr:shikimate kinase [Iamia majanohamensis]WCO68246.1 shikimate kinase [Iamia majanohamensis]
MAVGKSTVGRALAGRWGRPFVDTDDAIEAATGRTVRELWEAGGEDAYRPQERQAVLDALVATDPVVLAVPGGVAVDDDMASAVARDDVTTVYLRATAGTLAARVGDGDDHRPLLGDDPATALTHLLDERDGTYLALADHVVEVDARTPEQVEDAVRRALTGGGEPLRVALPPRPPAAPDPRDGSG